MRSAPRSPTRDKTKTKEKHSRKRVKNEKTGEMDIYNIISMFTSFKPHLCIRGDANEVIPFSKTGLTCAKINNEHAVFIQLFPNPLQVQGPLVCSTPNDSVPILFLIYMFRFLSCFCLSFSLFLFVLGGDPFFFLFVSSPLPFEWRKRLESKSTNRKQIAHTDREKLTVLMTSTAMPDEFTPTSGLQSTMPNGAGNSGELADSARLEWLWSEYERQIDEIKQYQEEGMDIYPTPGTYMHARTHRLVATSSVFKRAQHSYCMSCWLRFSNLYIPLVSSHSSSQVSS